METGRKTLSLGDKTKPSTTKWVEVYLDSDRSSPPVQLKPGAPPTSLPASLVCQIADSVLLNKLSMRGTHYNSLDSTNKRLRVGISLRLKELPEGLELEVLLSVI